MAQTHFYPCNETPESLCITCNAGLTAKDGSYGTNGTNGGKYTDPTTGKVANNPDPPLQCSTYCNINCNNECESSQRYCDIGYQSIVKHGDVGSYPGTTIQKDDFIHEKWSASYWNSLIDKIEMAESVGKKVSHGSAGSVTAGIGYPYFQTADLYNQVNTKLTNFRDASYSKVQVDQLITATVANAIQTAYTNAKFNASVCDVCNATGSQSVQECLCNCPTCSVCSSCPSCPTCSSCPSCACSCACSSCSCNCSSCSCNCSSCASPSTPPPLN